VTPAALPDLPATELVRLVRDREVSPVEIARACLDRVDAINPELNAIVTLNPKALDDAKALEERVARGDMPPLCGLTAGIKDVTPVAGLRTTYGSPIYETHVPSEDALVVQRLREAGAVIIGKTNCPEFAAGGNTFNECFGRTRNPWDPSKSAGGSTGGGAVGLATGMIAVAEGTDLGGSLRIPAAFCGVVGLRPSLGLVPTVPSDWPFDTLQVTGPMARSAADIALVLDAIAGPSDLAAISQPARQHTFSAGVRRGARVAYCADLIGIGVDPGIEQVCRSAVADLSRKGIEVEEVTLDLGEGRDAFLALRGYWFVAHMFGRLQHLDRFGSNVAGNIRAGLANSPASLGAAEQTRGRVREKVIERLRRYDYLLTPAMAVPPFPVEQNYPETVAGRKMETYVDWIAPTFVLSLTGLPVGAVPCGLDTEGLPVGLQIVGPPFGEATVLALAALVQETRPLQPPPIVSRFLASQV
jgi:amidase